MPAERIAAPQWELLAQKRIVFGHQSVGSDILAGVNTLAQRAGVSLRVGNGTAAGPGIVHFKIGRNGEPGSKMHAFAAALTAGGAAGADVALMKLCYVDFDRDTDGSALAREYCATLDLLGRQFPKTTFLAVTAPLTTVQSGPKAWLKRVLGREPAGYAENYRRQQFNAVLRERYLAQGRLFDLARLEAQGGQVTRQGVPLEVLDRRLSSDGGHLNDLGRELAAARLLTLIAALPEPPR